MKKIVQSEKKAATKEVVQPSSTESTLAVAPLLETVTPPHAAPAPVPTVVTTMTDSAVQECATLLDQVIVKLGDQAPLDVHEIRRATKMRKGGAEVIPKILALCLQYKVTQIGPLTTEEMSDELKRGDALVQVGLRGALVQKKVKDSVLGAHGRSWQIAMTMYTTLQRMAVDDPELALGLADVESFFQTKKTKGKVRANKRASAAKKAANATETAASAGASPAVTAHVPAAPVAAVPVAVSNSHGTPETSAANGTPAAATTATANGGAH